MYDFILLYPDNKSVFFKKAFANLNLICLATVYSTNNDAHFKAITIIINLVVRQHKHTQLKYKFKNKY